VDLGPYIDYQITVQQEEIESLKRRVKYLLACGVLIIVVSLVIDTVIYLKTGTRQAWGLSDFLKLGGSFAGVFAAFPYKDIPTKKALVANYILLKTNCQDWDKLTSTEHQLCFELYKVVITPPK
jgi:hypothetical protein